MTERLRSGLAILLDYLAVLAVATALGIGFTGGTYLHLGVIRISLHSVARPIVAACVAIALRLLLDRRTPAFGPLPHLLARAGNRAIRLGDPAISPAIPGRARRAAFAALGICAVAAVVLHTQIRHLFSVPDLGDPLFSIWRMAWVSHQIVRDPAHLFDGNIFYPDPLSLTYSDSMIVPALTAAPLLAVGIHPVIAYNLLFMSGFVFSALATYLLVERLTGSPRAAFIAAIIYGFYPYRFEHYSHLELQMTHWMPLALLALHLFIDTGRWPYAILLALAAAAQLYSSMYYAVFFALYACGVTIVLVYGSRAPVGRLVVPAFASLAVLVVVALPLVSAYVASTPIKGEREIAAVASYSADVSDYFRAHERSAMWGKRMRPERRAERELFPGVTPLLFAAGALVPPLGTIETAYVAGLLVAFDGSRGFNGVIYPYLYDWFPPVRSMRVPARFSIVGAVSLAVLAGFGVRRLLGRFEQRVAREIVFAVLIAAVAADVWPILELEPVWRDPPAVYAAIRGRPGVVLAEFPIHDEPLEFVENTPFMYFSLWHWRPLVNGYSGFTPPSYRDFVYAMIGFPSNSSIRALRHRGVTHVTVNCTFVGGGCEELLRQMDDTGAFRRVSEARWMGQTVRLYELAR